MFFLGGVISFLVWMMACGVFAPTISADTYILTTAIVVAGSMVAAAIAGGA